MISTGPVLTPVILWFILKENQSLSQHNHNYMEPLVCSLKECARLSKPSGYFFFPLSLTRVLSREMLQVESPPLWKPSLWFQAPGNPSRSSGQAQNLLGILAVLCSFPLSKKKSPNSHLCSLHWSFGEILENLRGISLPKLHPGKRVVSTWWYLVTALHVPHLSGVSFKTNSPTQVFPHQITLHEKRQVLILTF